MCRMANAAHAHAMRRVGRWTAGARAADSTVARDAGRMAGGCAGQFAAPEPLLDRRAARPVSATPRHITRDRRRIDAERVARGNRYFTERSAMAADAGGAAVAIKPAERGLDRMKLFPSLDVPAPDAEPRLAVEPAGAQGETARVSAAFETLGPWLEYVDQVVQRLLIWQQQHEDDRLNLAGLLQPVEALEASCAHPRGMPHWSSDSAAPWTTLHAPAAHGRLAELVNRFELTPFETQVLMLCVLPLFEPRYRALIAYLQGDEGASWPGVEFALTLFSATPVQRIAHRHLLGTDAGALVYHGLVYLAERNGRASTRDDASYLRVDETVYRYLSGADATSLPTALTQVAQWCSASCAGDVLRDGPWAACAQQIAACCFGAEPGRAPLLLLHPADGCLALIAQLARDASRPTLIVNLAALPDEMDEAWPLLLAALREARLHGSVLVLQQLADGVARHGRLLNALAPRLAGQLVVGLCSEQDASDVFATLPRVRVTLPPRTREDDAQVLQASLGRAGDAWDLTVLLQHTRINPDALESTLQEAHGYRVLRDAQAPLTPADLHQALRVRGQQHFGSLAQRVLPRRTFDDLIVSASVTEQLHEIIAAIRQRDAVLARGFAHKIGHATGISALFYGESGTGKSMAAEVLAGELGVELIRVDLSTVVNKYIGETEKNLSRIFDLAGADTGVLLFDEADALFGKRSEVKDAQDRHANIEVSYLLQRLEQYPGLVVLTTNNRSHLDDAFTRRLTFMTRFEAPDAHLREKMWRAIWPAQVAVDEEVDFAQLASVTELTGAGIRNVALLASWLAAEQSRAVNWADIARAVRRELSKTGRIMPPI
ncbi:ATP-dependent Zn proteases [Mycetohabitans rhizoxinica HKI 454]|uniref:ATP-dependent Zn proteases n=2 Tax=Burkholderiaceae TaxID=119060 RepID=E5ARP8_MYCRK|nr:ATP-dependent Zn proteases [Mycetohabitans rhizoxinica HKI 454]